MQVNTLVYTLNGHNLMLQETLPRCLLPVPCLHQAQVMPLPSIIALPTFSAIIILGEELIITLFGDKLSNAIPIMEILSLTGMYGIVDNLTIN